MDELDLTFVPQAVEKIGTGQEKVLELLQAIQGHFGYLPGEALLCLKIWDPHPGKLVRREGQPIVHDRDPHAIGDLRDADLYRR